MTEHQPPIPPYGHPDRDPDQPAPTPPTVTPLHTGHGITDNGTRWVSTGYGDNLTRWCLDCLQRTDAECPDPDEQNRRYEARADADGILHAVRKQPGGEPQ